MIYYFITSIKNNDNLKSLITSINNINKDFKIIVDIEFGTDKNIFQKYNALIKKYKEKIKEDDIVVFSHDDIEILDKHFIEKLELYFSIKKQVGLAGVIGTTLFNISGGWWMCDRTIFTRGRIIQETKEKTFEMSDRVGSFDSMVSIDGCIMFMNGKHISWFSFDDKTFNGYHFYDADSCFQFNNKGIDIGIIDVLIKHKSEGPLTKEWYFNKEKFLKKWSMLSFPVSKNSFNK